MPSEAIFEPAVVNKSAANTNLNVWLVDDNSQVRSIVIEVLQDHSGIKVTREFESGRAMLEALQNSAEPQVILLDVNLKDGECGLDLVRPALKLRPKVRVLVITTFFDSKAEQEAYRAGACGFLLKRDVASTWVQEINRLATARPAVPIPEPRPRALTKPVKPTFGFERLAMLRHLFSPGRRFASKVIKLAE